MSAYLGAAGDLAIPVGRFSKSFFVSAADQLEREQLKMLVAEAVR